MFGACPVYLDVFDVDKSLELLSKIVGADRVDAERDTSVELVSLCGGLPLALRIAGARLAAKPHWRISGLVTRLANEARRLDELTHHGLGLRSNIGLTYRSLPRQAQRLFRLFALISTPDLPGWTAAALLDTTLAEAEDVLEALVDAQLVDAVDYPGTRQFRYRLHDLIRLYARERLFETEEEDERNVAVGRVLGAWLALAEDAHRMEYGGDYTILHGDAARWRPADGSTADLIGDPMDWWEGERTALVIAVRQAATIGLAELCWDLALTSVTLFEAKGYFDDWRETSQLAHDATTRTGNRRGRAAMLYSLGTLHVFQKQLPEAAERLSSALAIFQADGDTHGCALVIRNSALVDRLHGNSVVMLAKYAEALDAMRIVGDRIGEAHILSGLAKFRIDEGEVEVAEDLLNAALAICRDVGCLRVEAQVLYRFAELHLGTNKIELSRQALHRVLLIVRDTGDPIGEAYALYSLGVVRHKEGRLGNAETTQLEALALATRVGEQLLEGQSLYALGAIALAKGDPAAAGGRLVEARRVFHNLGSALWHAKTLILMARMDDTAEQRRQHVEQARRLLDGLDSKESKRLLTELAGTVSGPPVGRTLGHGTDTELPKLSS
jgi:tetratricopeptide (TPR) repeat protein